MKEYFALLDEINSRNLWQEGLTLKRNEYLKVGGSVDANAYFIVSGSLRIFVVNEFEEHTLKKFINSSSALQQNWNSALEQIIIQLLEREQDILVFSPAQRYQRVLKKSPRLFQEIPNKYIASYIRMTPNRFLKL